MNKNEFIEKLRVRLEGYKEEDAKGVLEYYDELISEAVEAGKDEAEEIAKLGTIDSIIKKIEIERKVQKVEEKPTLSNGMIAIIAILGVITSPLWLVLIPVIGVLIIAVFIVLIALILSGVAIVLALIIALIGLLVGGFGAFSSATGVIGIIGAIIFMVGILMIGSKFIFNTFPVSVVKLFKKIVYKVKGV